MKKSELKEIIREAVFNAMTEELCARGKAYIAARKRAGEKSSAYLSGRAVKVCKGQIKGAGGKRRKSYKNEGDDAAMKKSALGMAMYGKKAKMKESELRELVRETIFNAVTEELCPKGKAYIAKRKRAGEKSSAYLSGRAVKVCKGQMKG